MVHRLNTISTTGAIGHACSGSIGAGAWVAVTSVLSESHFPVGTYYTGDVSVLESPQGHPACDVVARPGDDDHD
ncbi:hypothetical protein GCM10010532_071930 [Dactylosporangium siamense]|uniref:Uncharacterized protein n=1 Tax=Dactylosporangium siamense TaxID=685454 RepID=A0A919PRR1_9ACTN|nr:hypothetical protein Dsi01nite_053110 [Dactylosporangium siamense]